MSRYTSTSKIVLYTNKGCPFARRGWIAAIEKNLKFETHLIPLSGHLKLLESGKPLLGLGYGDVTLAEMQKIKADYKASVNATGEVPTVVVDGDIVTEADVVVEFLADAFPDSGEALVPSDPLLRSKVRHIQKVMNGALGSNAMYGLLMNQDPAKDQELVTKVHRGMETFAKLADEEGPYFLGKQISTADVMLMPMYDQFRFCLPYWRGVELIPDDKPWASRMARWGAAVEQRKSFTELSLGKELYESAYAGYAGARGQSTLETA